MGDSELPISFGEIFSGKITQTSDYESGLLDYSKPEYASNWQTYSDVLIQPVIQPYDNDTQTLRYDIGGVDDPLFTQLETLKVVGRARVLHEDGSLLVQNEPVSCVNLLPESLFSQINVFINGLPVNDHGRGSHMKAYINKQFSFTDEVKKCGMLNDFYMSDQVENVDLSWEDITEKSLKEETGLIGRSAVIAKSRDIFFSFKPTFDLMSCDRAFPPGYCLTLEFERSTAEFCLLAPTTAQKYKIRIYDMHLECRRFIPSRNALSHLPNPKTGTYYLPFTRQTVRHRSLMSGIVEYTVPKIADGSTALPYHILIIPISTTQCTDIRKNPYIFWPKTITRYSLLLNSASMPSKPIEIARDWKDNTRAYRHFLDNIGLPNMPNASNAISPFAFRYKDFCMAFDLTGDLCLGSHNHRPLSGNHEDIMA
jgi:hypothetical protein